ncbi:hypothetical protein IAU60_000388 [Kwoniella sp. DSM 27419]
MEDRGREETPMPTGPPVRTLGRLTLVKRKGGGDVQTIPLDAERITFGRDYGCDVRLYYSDVSKLHCEILFDETTGKATLDVRGTNGLLHTPLGGSSTTYKPPATISLTDGDTITIRKKPFRFEYGPGSELEAPFSPAVTREALPEVAPSPMKASMPGSPGQPPVRRRASHRLSLVPEGRTFVPLSPMKNRRNSSIGAGSAGTPRKTPARSKMNEVVAVEEEPEVEEEEDCVVDIVQGDEGDVVYLESHEEPTTNEEEEEVVTKPIHNNPFMTPQQVRKAPLRNTSVVARTKKVVVTEKVLIVNETPAVSHEEPTPSNVPEEVSPPKTPRSVPLPIPAETPYNAPVTPVKAKEPSTPVPANIAMSTPKGPATLRKALLLRSARKVWQQTRDTGVEEAIENGTVETRRKSLSPRVKGGRKSNGAISEAAEDEANNVETDEPEEASEGLQWVYEDGQPEASFDSESSGNDSLEADMSLDIPGEGVIRFDALAEDEEAYINDQPSRVASAEDPTEQDDAEQDGLSADEEVYEEYEQAVALSEGDSFDAMPNEDAVSALQQQGASVEVGEDGDQAMSLPGTPQRRQPMPNTFFTPQPPRGGLGAARRSLGGIGGPAQRLGTPSTPSSRLPRTPGSMGKPSRRLGVPARTPKQEVKEEIADAPRPAATPIRSESARAELQRRRETLATPRTLPAPPASGFKDPVREIRLAGTPIHPALVPKSPEPESEDETVPAVPATPMNELKKRLDRMRRQSVQKAERRATVGFNLPATPVGKPSFAASGSYSVNPVRVAGLAPRTPIFAKVEQNQKADLAEQENIASPIAKQQSYTVKQPSSPEYEPPSSPSTPLYTGLREMLNPAQPAKTPNLAGLKHLFPATPREAASPSLVGVKEMLRQPTVPATPLFAGMKAMFKHSKVPPTPAMEGVKEMYEEDMPEEEQEQQDQEEEEEEEQVEMNTTEDLIVLAADDSEEEEQEEIEQVERVRPVAVAAAESRLPAKAATVPVKAALNSRVPAPAPAKSASRIPAPRSAAVKASAGPSKSEPASRSSRVRQPAEESAESAAEPASRSTRTKRTASVDPEPASTRGGVSAASRSRSTRARSTAEPEEVAPVAQASADGASAKSSRGRPAATRSIPRVADSAETSKPSRGKNPLAQIEEQPVVEEKSASSSRAKRPAAAAAAVTSTTATATKKATSKSASGAETEKTSAPSRRKAPVKDKENDEDRAKEGGEKEVPKKRTAADSSAKSGVPVPVARVTRSRK